MISAEQYEAAVGHAPEQDDLDRSNCDKAGQIGHSQCGWDHKRNLPEFIAVAHRLKETLDFSRGKSRMTETDAIPFSERYDKWLDQCAMEFKNPAHVKAELARFVKKLRLEEATSDDRSLIPTDV
jgi:hypothetical protein